MKKLFTLSSLFVLLMGFNSFAQSVRLVLAEEFTQASCPPCATQNPTFNTLLNANPTKVCQIKYQTSWPGVDPMNAQTQTNVGPRVTYYGVSGVPTACMDGQYQRGSSYAGAPANWTASKLTTRQAVTSPYDLTVTHSLNATMDSMHITVTMTATGADSGSLVLHVAMIEREIPFCKTPGTNGEIVFEGVMRSMVPSYSGTALASTWTVGQTQTFDFDVKIPSYVYDKNTLGVVAFIQDNSIVTTTTISGALNSTSLTVGSSAGLAVGMYVNGTGLGSGKVITAISGNTLTLSGKTSTTIPVAGNGTFSIKDVRQSAYSEPQLLVNDARIECDGLDVPAISCGNPITPAILIKNEGSAPLTSLTMDYTIDGVSQAPVQWTGSIASGSTGTINIPFATVPTTIGTHQIAVTLTYPNSAVDYNVYYDAATVSYSVSAAIGSAAPLSQAFSSAVYPPANWNIINGGGSGTWARSTANASVSGTGCSKIDFYNITDGDVDELVLPSYDFSDPAITSVILEFDQAYAQYNSGSNDKLEVFYSLNCGQSWTSAYSKAGQFLAQGNAATTSAFTPTLAQWHHETVTLNGAVGNNNVFVSFKATSNFGNNAYVDNINLNSNITLTGVGNVFTDREVMVYPNPSQGRFNVKMNFDNGQDVTITVTDALGAVVKTVKIPNVTSELIPVDLTGAAKGSYEVSVQSVTKLVTKRITITE
jgi:hypothetical protein